jgi:hypothetical protein
MARIRTIKPEFWTSEQVAACSLTARLLFIGLWNFCDDGGIHPASYLRLKMEIFPADNFGTDQIQDLVKELISNKLIVEYEVENQKYWRVTGWKHQKIEKPHKKYPPPHNNAQEIATDSSSVSDKDDVNKTPVVDQSSTEQRLCDSHSPPEGKGMEWNGMEWNGDKISQQQEVAVLELRSSALDIFETEKIPSEKHQPCPYHEIVEAYHRLLPDVPRVRDLTKSRKRSMQARWKENPRFDFFETMFAEIAKSPFLLGQEHAKDRAPFVLTIDWLMKPENFVKVAEGKYSQRKKK